MLEPWGPTRRQLVCIILIMAHLSPTSSPTKPQAKSVESIKTSSRSDGDSDNSDVWQCGNTTCLQDNAEVCLAQFDKAGELQSETCSTQQQFFDTCSALSCARGMSCRVAQHSGSPHQVHVGCVYQSEELDRFAAQHREQEGEADLNAGDDLVPGEDDTPVAWCIVIAILSLLPLIVLACIVVYRFVYKLPRIGREKAELTRLFQTLGYDENTEIYKKVIDFFYR